MVCYAIPLAAAVISSAVWGAQRRGPAGWWLNLLLYGGAIFGFVDHLWYGQLLFVGNLVSDLMLGVAITATIFAGWGTTLVFAKKHPAMARRMGYRIGLLSQSR